MFYTAKIWDFLIKILRIFTLCCIFIFIFTLCCIFIFRRGNILSFLQKIPPDAVDSPGSHTRIAMQTSRYIYFIFLGFLLQQKKLARNIL